MSCPVTAKPFPTDSKVDGELAQRKFTFLFGEICAAYPRVGLARKVGRTGQPVSCRTEVSRGRSSQPTWVVEGPKGTSKHVSTASYDGPFVRKCTAVRRPIIRSDAFDPMAWDASSDYVLKLVLNRLVRTRMPGDVGGVPEQSGLLSRSHSLATLV